MIGEQNLAHLGTYDTLRGKYRTPHLLLCGFLNLHKRRMFFVRGIGIGRKFQPCGHPKAQHVPDQERRHRARRCSVLRWQCPSRCLVLQLGGWRVLDEGVEVSWVVYTISSDCHFRRSFPTEISGSPTDFFVFRARSSVVPLSFGSE